MSIDHIWNSKGVEGLYTCNTLWFNKLPLHLYNSQSLAYYSTYFVKCVYKHFSHTQTVITTNFHKVGAEIW